MLFPFIAILFYYIWFTRNSGKLVYQRDYNWIITSVPEEIITGLQKMFAGNNMEKTQQTYLAYSTNNVPKINIIIFFTVIISFIREINTSSVKKIWLM